MGRGLKKLKISASTPLFQNYRVLAAKRCFLCPKAHIFLEILAALGYKRGKAFPCAPKPIYILRFPSLALMQGLVHFFDVIPASDILYNPNNYENKDKNSKITCNSFQTMFHPKCHISDRHHNYGDN